MLKAILYYLLLIAEFLITIILCGLVVGMYMSVAMQTGYYGKNEQAFANATFPIMVGFLLVSILIIWGTFGYYKFSKFSLGKVQPAAKWKTMLYTTLPIFGFTLAFYAFMELFHIKFLPKEMTEMKYTIFLPYAFFGSFLSAYVFYGAIQEELIKSGKKLWVQMLTLCIMMLPACAMVVTSEGDVSLHFTIIGMISTLYACWVYEKTRSTIILLVVYLLPNFIPFTTGSVPLSIALLVVGIALTIYGGITVKKKLPEMLEEKDEDE